MLTSYLPGIRLQIQISRLFASIPYKWDKKMNRLVYDNSPKYQKCYRLGRFVHATYASFMFSSFVHMWMTSSTDGISVAQVLSIGWICCHCGSGLLRIGVAHKMNELMKLINSMVEFEETLIKGKSFNKMLQLIMSLSEELYILH